MSLINTLVSRIAKRRIPSIEKFIDHPIEVQETVFKSLLSKASKTEWGLKYGYKSINSLKDYKSRVPLQDYASLKPDIDRMMSGENNILWNGRVQWYAKSSGTATGRSKFIPVSREILEACHFRGGRDVIALYVNSHRNSRLFTGKGLIMGGSTTVNMTSKAATGDISAVMMSNMPAIARWFNTPKPSLALEEDWEKKLDSIVRITSNQDITHLAGVPTWTLVLLRKMLKQFGKSNILEIWPNLELYIHGGVSFSPYRHQFDEIAPSEKMTFMETYNASEGFFAIQNDLNEEDLLLLLDHGVFFEFLPLGEGGSEETVQLEEVRTGIDYALIISTCGGLWRYKIGDTVRFTSTSPFKIKLSGRTSQFINAFGEEVIIDNSDEALTNACRETASMMKDYTVAPVFLEKGKKGCHEWFIEFGTAPQDLSRFTEILDSSLRAINSDYDAKRSKDLALGLPIVHSMPLGFFYDWMKARNKLGGQNKVPRLSNDRKYAQEINSFWDSKTIS